MLGTTTHDVLCITAQNIWHKMAPEVGPRLHVCNLVGMNIFPLVLAVWSSHEDYLFMSLAHLFMDACFLNIY